METTTEEKTVEQEWQWCLVGNIVGEHKYGGMGHESILVIGNPRHSRRYIEIAIARKYVENFRLQKVYRPAVLRQMNQSKWDWWGNTDSTRDRLINVLELYSFFSSTNTNPLFTRVSDLLSPHSSPDF